MNDKYRSVWTGSAEPFVSWLKFTVEVIMGAASSVPTAWSCLPMQWNVLTNVLFVRRSLPVLHVLYIVTSLTCGNRFVVSCVTPDHVWLSVTRCSPSGIMPIDSVPIGGIRNFADSRGFRGPFYRLAGTGFSSISVYFVASTDKKEIDYTRMLDKPSDGDYTFL